MEKNEKGTTHRPWKMSKDSSQSIEAIDEQIRKLRALRKRWADGKALSSEEKARQAWTLELLDGALYDLVGKRKALKDK